MLFWHSPRLFSLACCSSKFIKAKTMPNLKKWSGLFSILVTEILNLRDCSQKRRTAAGLWSTTFPHSTNLRGVISNIFLISPPAACTGKKA